MVDNADSKEAEHGHTERGQPNAHRSHCGWRELVLLLLLVTLRTARCSRRREARDKRGLAGVTWLQRRLKRLSRATFYCICIHTSAFMCRVTTMSTADEHIAAGRQTEATHELIPAVSSTLNTRPSGMKPPDKQLSALSIRTFRQCHTRTTDLIPPWSRWCRSANRTITTLFSHFPSQRYAEAQQRLEPLRLLPVQR